MIGVFGYATGLFLSVLLDLPTGPIIVWMLAVIGMIVHFVTGLRINSAEANPKQALSLNLDSSVDRLLPAIRSCECIHFCFLEHHQMGEHATHPIARFLSRPASLLRLA